MNAIHALSQLSYSPRIFQILTTGLTHVNIILTKWVAFHYRLGQKGSAPSRPKAAGVVKLVDALDSKSSGPQVRVGSIPTSGTIRQ